MTASEQPLPHWDLNVVYPGLASEAFAAAFQALVAGIDDLTAWFDRHGISSGAAPLPEPEAVSILEELIARMDDMATRARTMYAYLFGHIATDSRDDLAQARWSEFQQHRVRLSLLETRLAAWVGSLDLDPLLARSNPAREHAFVLHKMQQQARHLMSPPEEVLAAELDLSGAKAWAKLHSTFTSQLVVPVELEGQVQSLPMSEVRNLAYHADRDVRRRAYQAEIETWRQAQVPLAAALNGIKGQVVLLDGHRGWDGALDKALFENHIDRQTLEAMMAAARAAFPSFRRYLAAKARLLGLPVLAWYDLFAPAGSAQREWPFDQAREFIVAQFATYSARLSHLAKRAFTERWIDAQPRVGKRDGAFCMWLKEDRSGVFANYKPVYSGMSTLAHELGHAYHNLNLAGRSMLQRDTPMTLAETASIFCQTIVREATMAQAAQEEQLSILEAELQNACQLVVDISSRFLFEQQVFEQRRGRELSAAEFCRLMLDAQKETYGDGLDPEQLHPYMWALKPHYYSGSRSFYNFPYMFGLLFGLGLYARFQADRQAFQAGYDDLLSSTGMDDAATLAARFGIDVRSPGFWQDSLHVVEVDIDRFVALVDRQAG